MIVFSANITDRLKYVCDFIGKEFFNSPITLTNDTIIFNEYEGSKINYSQNPLPDSFQLIPHGLLFESGIQLQQIKCTEFNGRKIFFQSKGGDFPFDIFSAIFYLLSRYEEYLPHQKDEYGRFSHTSSLAFREGFLQEPLINCWLEQLRQALILKFPRLIIRRGSFQFMPTYDIDIAWKYRNKGLMRNLGGAVQGILRGEWSSVGERIRVLRHKQKDPFDAYEWLDALHLYCRLKPYYFFLVAEQQKGYDKNIDPDNKDLRDLIKYYAIVGTVGIHPSWQSGDQPKLLKEETGLLEVIADHPIRHSRQHYLRFDLPNTFRQLITAGIKEDFSMGYGTINGFRASVASPFHWFDLEKNKSTPLLLFPFCFMDANAFYEQKLTAEQAFNELMQFYYAIKKVNGLMITIWHNNFLGSENGLLQWRDTYEMFLRDEVYWDS